MVSLEENMIEEKNIKTPPKVIFLIGAGVSVPLGIPAMQGYFTSYMKNKNIDKKTCNMLINNLEVKEDLEDFLLAVNTIIEAKDSNFIKLVEKIIYRQKENSKLEEFRSKMNLQIDNIRLVRTSILEFMSKTCFQFERPKARDIFSNLIKAVAGSGYPIYTTNYDFAFEYVAQDYNITIQDNFIRKGQRNIWNNKIEFPIGNALTIIKLHGSVNWYKDDNGTVEKIDAYTNLNPEGRDIERLVVFPTRFKDIYDQHFFALYSHFLSSLSDAKCLIIIGHSLRDEYLRAGIIERFRKDNFKLIVIDPQFPLNLRSEIKPEQIGRHGNVTHIPILFEEFSDDLSDIIMNRPYDDLAPNCAAVIKYGRSKHNKVKIKGKLGNLKPGQKKQFKVLIDAYIPKEVRPAYLRVWLKHNYKTQTGEDKREVSTNYIEEGSNPVAEGLSGLINKEIPVTIEIPEYSSWLTHVEKVALCVGIITKQYTKPHTTTAASILAVDQRELAYSKIIAFEAKKNI